MKKTVLAFLIASLFSANFALAQKQTSKTNLQDKVNQYATVPLKYDVQQLEPREQELLGILIQIADVMNDIYWEQALGREDRAKTRKMDNAAMKDYFQINYGPWDRLDGNKPFVPGIGPKPAGANFYPTDITKEEFEKIKDPQKNSPYTILQRNKNGVVEVIPYNKAYQKHLKRADILLEKAIELTENEEFRKYLESRRNALRTDEYLESDMIWMDMKKNRIDFVFGPIENYEDGLFGIKAAHEAFVLVKDQEWSDRLEHFTHMLPELQKQLPCDPKYKKETPGTESDINVYDVIYYAGNCNAGGKTIAINLPNDEKVQIEKGTRRLQLKNTMQAKFETILLPIASHLISKDQLKNVKFDAFFNNVCFHEVAHGLGIKKTVNGKKTVREALQNQYSAWEEAKADICGLFMVQSLIEQGQIKDITIEDAYVTYMAGLLRSVRFGATEAHGIANIMCFNYMQDNGAFARNKEGKYVVNVKKMRTAIEGWAALVLKTEGDGNYLTAKSYADKNGIVRPELAKDLKRLEAAKIPVDIRFEQGPEVIGLKEDRSAAPVMIRDDSNLRLRP